MQVNIMKEMKLNKLYSVYCYDKDDYFTNNKDVNDSCLGIISSHESNNASYDFDKAREYLENLNYNMYLDNMDTRIYVLKREGEPVSFALYNKIENTNDWVLELIYTHSEYTTLGLGTVLLRSSACDLRNNGAENIHTTVAKNNDASFNLHKSFSKVEGVKTSVDDVDNRLKFMFNIKEMKTDKTKDEAEEILF